MRYRFAGFELDEERYELRRGSTRIPLQPKVMEVLRELLGHAERTLTRDELLDAVWPGVAVGEASLTRCISQARRALGEGEADARIIQTVRGRGYRIGVPVTQLPAADTASPRGATGAGRRPRGPTWGALLAGALAAAGLAAWLARPFADLGPLLPSPLTQTGLDRSVAVLPFGGLRDHGEAVALDVVGRLSEVTELLVLSPSESFALARGPGAPRGPMAIGAELGVGSLVVGRVRARDDRLHVDVELVDATSGFRQWSSSHEGSLAEPGPLRAEVAGAVRAALLVEVQRGAEFVHRAPEVDADRFRLEGRSAILASTRDELLDRVALYERAIEREPGEPDAHVALAAAYERLWSDDAPGLGWLSRAETVVLRALELDPASEQAWAVHGAVLRAKGDWTGAEAALERSVELGPSPVSLGALARLRCMQGRPEDALPVIQRALELDPLSHSVQHTAGRVYYYLGANERAIAHLRRAHQLAPRSAYVVATLASALGAAGREAEATEVFLLALPGWLRPPLRIHQRFVGAEAGVRLLLALDAAASGRPCGRDAYESAVLHARARDPDPMLACLEEAARHHLWYVRAEPIFDPYRGDPRFRQILASAGFDAPEPLAGDASSPGSGS